MFSDEILEQIFSDERTFNVPIVFQTIMIKVIEDVLQNNVNDD